MALQEQITHDLTAAMKERQQEKLDSLRMLSAALKNEQIALGHELSDDEVLKVISRQIKQRREAADQYRIGGREESAQKEEAEAAIFEVYLPAQMSDQELTKIVDAALAATGAAGIADMGKVIGAVRAKTGNAADGSRIAALVKEKLGA